MARKAHPADRRPTAERNKPRPSESRKRLPARLRGPTVDATKYPNLEANQALDRALHIHHAMQMGATRAEAEAHADEHVGPRVRRGLPTRRKGARKVLDGDDEVQSRRIARSPPRTPRRRG